MFTTSNCTLSISPKGKKLQYTVTDPSGNVLVTRLFSRDNFVACTEDASYFFGRVDLVGRGDHGRRCATIQAWLHNPEAAYAEQLNSIIPSHRKQWALNNPKDAVVLDM